MATLEEQLADVRGVLEADGFELKIDGLEDGLLRLTVTPGEEACEDCLMPKDIMIMMVTDALQSRSEVSRVEVCYPRN
ncbi:MAG: hypothetical protein Q7O66_20075 [Dehalococcoidia bacterium]|nr:hypothetical protein [Dehalococcoidia bacterium]